MEPEQTPPAQDLPKYTLQQQEKIDREKERRKQWRKEMEENVELQEYFKQFDPTSVQHFIERLLTDKNMWLENGPACEDRMNTEGIRWVEAAHDHLEIIQQKKLFNMQCLWRAEQITIDQVDVSVEFELWDTNILNCPFVDPVSEADVDLYCQYLQQTNPDEYDFYRPYQNYEEIKEAYGTETWLAFMDWYDFYDSRRGTGVLLTLPNTRGQKEEFYEALVREERQTEPPPPPRPVIQYLNYHDKQKREDYLEKFESKKIRNLCRAFEWNLKKNCENNMHDELRILLTADELIPIEGHHDWREAAKKAARKYLTQKIIEALPTAWQQYMLNIQLGIAFKMRDDFQEHFDHIKKWESKGIIEGRILNGEPGDLNF